MVAETPETKPTPSDPLLSGWQRMMIVLVLLFGILPPAQIFVFMAKGPSLQSPEELRWGCFFPLLWLATMGTTVYALLEIRGRRLVWRVIATVLSLLLLGPAVESWCVFFQARTSLVPPYYGFYPWLPTPVNLVALATTTRMSWRGWISVIGVGMLIAVALAAVSKPYVRPVVDRIRAQYPPVRQVLDCWESASVRSPESAHIRWDDFWVTGIWAESAPIREITPNLIAQCPRLRYLDLASTGVDDGDMAGVEALQDLQDLSLNHTRVGDVTVERLAQLPRLEKLELANTAITNDGLAHLRDAQQLRQLDLGNTRISGAGARHLTGLKELHELSLRGTDVRDEVLKHLATMKSLEKLDLSMTAITDDGLQYLLDLASLERLNVAGTEATLEGVAEWKTLFKDRHGSQCWVRGKDPPR
jgi:hypothetical protein